ncbi:MAG: sodium:solute symporter [Bacteroidetes bacterium]|nr:sodium:solute symporter [Bacteroidota bacterium]
MDHYGFLSIIPPLAAILLAIKTRQVYLSLLIGIWSGWIILDGGNLFTGSISAIESLVNVFADPGNTRTILFSCLIGGLLALIQRSGGVEGFVKRINNRLSSLNTHSKSNNRIIQLFSFFTGAIIFVETNISVLTTGSIFRPVFDKYKIAREKLAYIIDSTSAPVCILIPFNAWGAYIIGLLALNGIEDPFTTLFQSYIFNLYPILTIALLLFLIISGKDFGPMRKAMIRAEKEGKILRDGARPLVSSDITSLHKKEGINAKSFNMLTPIILMVLMMPIVLIISGWNSSEYITSLSFNEKILEAIRNGSGSQAVLLSVIAAIFVSVVLYKSQRILSIKEMTDLILKGMGGLVPLALLMLLAFAIGSLCKELGTGLYVSQLVGDLLTPKLVPAIIFIISGFIAFSTGTSWGTFAIMLSIGIPIANSMGIDQNIIIGAVLGGGVFGDHCSPISDTTIVSSMAAACDHIDHVKTQLPYALTTGLISVLIYIIIGYIFL